MTAHIFTAAAAATILLAAAASAHAVEFGAADDGNFNHGTNTTQVLDSMAAHDVTTVRLIAWSDRSYANQLDAARQATARGLRVTVVLSSYIGQDPPSAAWFHTAAQDFTAAGATEFSVLNEPDLYLPADDRCDTDREVTYRITSAGMRTVVVVRRVWRHVTRRFARRHHLRRYKRVHARTPGGRLVTRYRRARHGRWVHVRRRVHRVIPTTIDSTGHTYQPVTGCLEVARARITSRVYNYAIPAIRSAAPDARILIGETSPCTGVEVFTGELVRLGLPTAADGWAHHPYPGGGGWALANAQRVDETVGLPVYWTEFGVPIRRHDPDMTSADARAIWHDALAMADRLGVRRVVAYGWMATGLPWDTAAEGVLW